MSTAMNSYPELNGYEGIAEKIQKGTAAVIHFFTKQMTSPRPEQAMHDEHIERHEGVVDLDMPAFAPQWVEAGRE